MSALIHSKNLRKDFLAPVVNQLIKLRIQQCYSQEELNYKIGMCDGQIARYESGHRTPSIFTLHCWADALDSKIAIVANDNVPPTIPNEMAKAVNDNKLQIVA